MLWIIRLIAVLALELVLTTEELETEEELVPVKQVDVRTSQRVAPVPFVPCTAACTLEESKMVRLV